MNNTSSSSNEIISQDGKTIAIISYITIIGTIIAYVMNAQKKDPFAWFHIRQMIGLGLISLLLWAFSIVPVLGLLALPLNLAMIILWVLGLVNAINGRNDPVPIIGAHIQDWLKGLN